MGPAGRAERTSSSCVWKELLRVVEVWQGVPEEAKVRYSTRHQAPRPFSVCLGCVIQVARLSFLFLLFCGAYSQLLLGLPRAIPGLPLVRAEMQWLFNGVTGHVATAGAVCVWLQEEACGGTGDCVRAPVCVCGGQGALEVAFGEPDQRHSLGTCSLFEADPLAEGFRHRPTAGDCTRPSVVHPGLSGGGGRASPPEESPVSFLYLLLES